MNYFLFEPIFLFFFFLYSLWNDFPTSFVVLWQKFPTTLQVTVWGDYGRMDKKVFMGVAQILLEDLDLSNIVIGWYKLFPTSSLYGHHSSNASLSQAGIGGSSTSLETLMSSRT